MEEKVLEGYGAIKKLTVNEEAFGEWGEALEFGELLTVRFGVARGGNVWNKLAELVGGGPTGVWSAMGEFERGWIVVMFDGEYINVTYFRKGENEE